jgi:hypothetical protein
MKQTPTYDYLQLLLGFAGIILIAYLLTLDLYFGCSTETYARFSFSGLIFFAFYIYSFKSYLISERR